MHKTRQQESSAKPTNQRVSYATSSGFSFHARHILPTSKFQHSYSVNSMCENYKCEYSSLE